MQTNIRKSLSMLGAIGLLVVTCGQLSVGQEQSPALAEGAESFRYPIAIAVTQDSNRYVVDLNLPGIWHIDPEGNLRIHTKGPGKLGKPLNRPRCIAIEVGGDLLVSDTPAREIYRLPSAGGEASPITDGDIGIGMCIVVADESLAYVGDLETQTILKLDLKTGETTPFAEVSARGLALDKEGNLWAITQGENQLVRFDDAGAATPVVQGRPFRFPHSLVVTESGEAYVTDGYSHAIWRVAEGKAEKWLEGEPLINPVGIAMDGGALLVTDSKAKQVWRIDLESKEIKPLTGP